MIKQYEITLRARPRGFHLITREVFSQIASLPQTGLLHIFIKHTSAALTINENADPDVLTDLDKFMDKIVPEGMSFLRHTMEGPDDMPAHVKVSLIGNSVSIPITNGRPNLGTWQGLYLGEFRNHGGARRLVVTVQG